MAAAATRRGNFFGNEKITSLDGSKPSTKDILIDKSSKFDQENIHNVAKIGSSANIPDSYVGYSNIPDQVCFAFGFVIYRLFGVPFDRVLILI